MATPPQPRVPAPIAAASASLFGLASRIRGKRIFHPHGVGFEATLEVRAPSRYADVELLRAERSWRAIVRLSRGLGLPPSVPDVLGVAIRVVDAYGSDRHQDFLLVSSARGPIWQRQFLPAPGGFGRHSYSSLLLYRIGSHLRIVGAEPVGNSAGERIDVTELRSEPRPDIGFALTLATRRGGRVKVGRLELGARLGDAYTEALAFNPWNTGGGIVPAGPVMGLRQRSYAASQAARGASRVCFGASANPSRGEQTWA
jgi:hypothetical protein